MQLTPGWRHPRAAVALDAWYRLMKRAEPCNHGALKALFNSADRVGKYYVFDIAGNRYRLVAAVQFNRGKVFVREVMTHAEYDEWSPP